MKRKYKVLIFVIAGIALLIGITAVSLSAYMVKATEKSIFTAETFKSEKKADCILILGAGVKDGKPKPMLRDRLLTGIELYKSGAADKIIMSGDHGRADYDEVNVMRSFAIEQGVRAEDIFLDHAGFSTYDSIYRAKKYFRRRKHYNGKPKISFIPRALHCKKARRGIFGRSCRS